MSSVTTATTVACNIYITASSSHKSTLLRLLRTAQEQCEKLRRCACTTTMEQQRRSSSNGSSGINVGISPLVGVIHAYADVPYDRSSFHLAGQSDCVAIVARELIRTALTDIDIIILPTTSTTFEGDDTRHPYVGLVDHVSVMPLNYYQSSTNETRERSQSLLSSQEQVYSNYETTTNNNNNDQYKVAANVAYEIGKQMMETTQLVTVHYYGHACPQATPLVDVRRRRTTFFNSGGATDSTRRGTKQNSQHIPAITVALKGDSIVGVPNNFVENFNIRLTSNVTFHQAKSLTQLLRGRNIMNNGYGIDGVEALTLKYARDDILSSQGGDGGTTVYEVACNITKPKVGGVTEILAQLEKWIILQQQQQQCHQSLSTIEITDKDYKYYVEDAYRVGTTQEQCLQVLFDGRDSVQNCDNNISMTNDEIYWEEYDKQVFNKFDKLLS